MTIRVLHLINGLGTGGSERSLADILPGLASHGLISTLACFYRRPEGVQDDLVATGFDVRFIEETGLAGRVRAVRRLIQQGRIDLVHTTHFEADLAGRLGALGTGVPVLTSLVSTPYAEARFRDPRVNRVKLSMVRAIDGWTGRHLCAHFHAVSHTVKSAAVRQTRFREDRISVVERGRSAVRFATITPERRRRARNDLNLADADEVVVNLGRHEFAKGQAMLLDAVAALLPGHPRLVLALAGRDGAVSEHLRRRTRDLGLDRHVRFLGHRDDVVPVLDAADVFAFPSRYEGLPGAVLEAMAVGLPIVASRIDGVAEAVEEGRNALLSAPGDAEEFGGHLHELLSVPERAAEFGGHSRKVFEARFTLDRCTQRMAALLSRIAQAGPQPREGS